MLRYCFVLAEALWLTAPVCAAQKPVATIAIDVSEDTGGLFASGFASAIRGLGDVQVVSLAESPQYVLRIVVLCQPKPEDCQNATHYDIALMFSKPLSKFAVWYAIASADSGVKDDQADSAFARLPATEEVERLAVSNWGRQVYEQGIREYVAELDHGCFERARMFDREAAAIRAKDRPAAQAIEKEIGQQHWIC